MIARYAAAAIGLLYACTIGLGTGHAAPGHPVIGGGSGIVVDDTSLCTVTTVGHDARGRLVGMTAGHCGDAGASIAAGADRAAGPIGRIALSDSDLDY
ncbi:serine protease, partial [Nocardia gipuzkoensis]